MNTIIIKGDFEIQSDLPIFEKLVKKMKYLELEVDNYCPVRVLQFEGKEIEELKEKKKDGRINYWATKKIKKPNIVKFTR